MTISDTARLRKVALGQPGLDYARSRLEHGHILAAVLAGRLQRDGRAATTYLPPGVPPGTVQDFRTGGKFAQGDARVAPDGSVAIRVTNAYAQLAKLMDEHLRRSPRSAVVMENPNARRGDPYLAVQKSRLVYFGEEVLHVLDQRDSSSDVEMTIRESKSTPTFIGAFTAIPDPVVANGELTAWQMGALARDSTALFVGAYDGEGFVLVDLE